MQPGWVRALSLSTLLAVSASAPVAAQTRDIPDREAAARSAPRDAAAQTALGMAYLRAGRYADAQRQMEKAASLDKSPRAVMHVAMVAIAQDDFKRAKTTCKKLFAETKVSPVAHLCMARAFLAWNRTERAFEELDLALADDPSLAEAWLVRGEAHRLRGQVSEAESAYAKAKPEPALAAEADLGLGQLYAAAGRRDEAIAALRRSLASATNMPETELALGELLGATDEARTLLEAALENRPGWAEAARALGDAKRQAGDMAGAESAYRRAVAADPNQARAFAGLGEVLFAQGKLDEAKAALDKSLSLVATNPAAVIVLGETLAKQGALDEAVEQLRHAADLDPRNPAPLMRAAELLVSQRRNTLAAGFLDRLLEAHPKHGPALALYGDVMLSRGDKVSAKQYYERALAAGGVERGAIEAKLRAL